MRREESDQDLAGSDRASLGRTFLDACPSRGNAKPTWSALLCMRVFVGYMSGLRLMTLRAPELPELVGRGRPAVVVANHPSLLDVVML
jgi:1-acyl-sn-glycerol-3-phosphate acyltransferase